MDMSKKKPYIKKRVFGPKLAIKFKEVQQITQNLYDEGKIRDLALFRCGIDTMLRASDLVRLYLSEVTDRSGEPLKRTSVLMKKTGEIVEVSLLAETREALKLWIAERPPFSGVWLFPGGRKGQPLTEQRYRQRLKVWIEQIGQDPALYSTHSIRRTKASTMYEANKDIKAVSMLLGHRDTKITERYLGVTREDALSQAERTKI